ncbi:MAG: hypothetical protein ACPGJS_00535 [Flammeovirgaceae bacterium]
MAHFKSIAVEVKEQKQLPDHAASFTSIAIQTIPVFIDFNQSARFEVISVNTTKALIASAELIEILPFVSNPSFQNLQLVHPHETNSLPISYQAGTIPIHQYFGADPEELSVEFEYGGDGVDLITNSTYTITFITIPLSCILSYE